MLEMMFLYSIYFFIPIFNPLPTDFQAKKSLIFLPKYNDIKYIGKNN